MALHPLAARFADVADSYQRGRPEYAPVVVEALAAELGLAPGARVLDLAAGTGKLSRALLAAGFDLVAVEPLEELRRLLVDSVGAARVLDGLAERIPVADASVDAVTVADAFHWFDQPLALAEIRRVLRPPGGLALLSTTPDWSQASWSHQVGHLVQRLRPEHPGFDGAPWREVVRHAGGWSQLREIRVSAPQPTTPERVVDYVGSISWFAAMPHDQRAQALAEVRALVTAGETPAEFPIHVTLNLTAPT